MWWIILTILLVAITIPVIWFMRLMSKQGKANEEIERVGGIEAWSKGLRDRIHKNDESMRRSRERTLRMTTASQETNEFSNTISLLEQQLKQVAFSDVELEEVIEDKRRLTDISLQAQKLADRMTELSEEHMKLFNRAIKLVEKGTSKESSEQLSILYANIDSLESELDSVDRENINITEKLHVSRSKIEQWITLGNSRTGK